MHGLVGIGPVQFVHVLDVTNNIKRLEVGPKRLILQHHEELTAGPLPCIIVPPGYYCTIKNPIKKYEAGKQCELNHGHVEVRFHQEPFPLYPGETLIGCENFGDDKRDYTHAIHRLPVVKANQAIRLKARADHISDGKQRKAGDMWQLDGPLTYKPTADAEVVGIIDAETIFQNSAIRLKAKQSLTDSQGIKREAGEEWLIKKRGSYLPGVYEEVVDVIPAYVLKPNIGLHLRAAHSCKDALGKDRQAGEEWLVTGEITESYIPEIGEVIVKPVTKIVLQKGEFCVIDNPVDNQDHCHLGLSILKTGVSSFFLHPGEIIRDGIQKQFVLGPDQAVVLQANQDFKDQSHPEKISRKSGDRWMVRGPVTFIPPIEVHVVDQGNGQVVRQAIPLAENEGVYIRNLQTGEVSAVMGPTAYLLTEHEQLWEKELTPLVEDILRSGGGVGTGDIRKLAYFESSIDPEYADNKKRDKTRVVRYRCPHNTAVQVYKYQEKSARTVFGPDMVILGPHEDFNVLSLSAGKPKVEHALKTICLMLGPDYITDILEVETADHARLRIKLAFNNFFEFDRNCQESSKAIFSVPDFIGFACRQIGSRVRGAVSRVKFDEFHKNSMKLLKVGVFGIDSEGNLRDQLKFKANNLVITNLDVQSIEPVDNTMRDSLLKSVQMAIEISTRSIERTAGHDAARKEQQAKGQLERQKLISQKDAEKAKSALYELQAETAAVESTGQAKAEAQAQAEKLLIEGQSHIQSAKLKAEADNILHYSELQVQQMMRDAELKYLKEQNSIEVNRSLKLSEIEVNKFSQMVKVIGADTISSIATSGPTTQVKLLQSLGIEMTLITDGNSPINLLNVGSKLVEQTSK